jgi:hypothetical protein
VWAGVWALGVLAWTGGCGLKGKPVPPEQVLPGSPSELRLAVTPEGIRASCRVPQHYSDGSALSDLEALEFQRASIGPKDCADCPVSYSVIGEVRYSYPTGELMPQGSVEFLDPVRKPGRYQYRAVARTVRGVQGKPSSKAEIYWDVPPGRVEGLAARVADRQVALRWEAVRNRTDGSLLGPEQVGYQLFRKRREGGFGHAPIHSSPLKEPQFVDTAVQNDVAYGYRVRSVISVEGRLVPGAFSEEIEAVPERLFPPKAPAGVVAFGTATGVRLVWERGEKADVAGFRVYRAERQGGPWELLTEQPLSTVFFDDTQAVRGRTYWYAITALDDSQPPKESVRSEPVRVHFPVGAPPTESGSKPAR